MVSYSRGGIHPYGANPWRFSLRPQDHPAIQIDTELGPVALNCHGLPSIRSLVCYLHVAVGFLVNSTWITAIKAGNFTSWPGLTYANVLKY